SIGATSGSKFNIDITSLTLADTAGDVAVFDNTANYSWRILKTTTGITSFDPTAFNLNAAGTFGNSLGGGHFSLAIGHSGKDLIPGFIPARALLGPAPKNVRFAGAAPAATDAASFIGRGGTSSNNCGAVTASSSDLKKNQTCLNNFTITRTY